MHILDSVHICTICGYILFAQMHYSNNLHTQNIYVVQIGNKFNDFNKKIIQNDE